MSGDRPLPERMAAQEATTNALLSEFREFRDEYRKDRSDDLDRWKTLDDRQRKTDQLVWKGVGILSAIAAFFSVVGGSITSWFIGRNA